MKPHFANEGNRDAIPDVHAFHHSATDGRIRFMEANAMTPDELDQWRWEQAIEAVDALGLTAKDYGDPLVIAIRARLVREDVRPDKAKYNCSECNDTGKVWDRVDGDITCPGCGYPQSPNYKSQGAGGRQAPNVPHVVYDQKMPPYHYQNPYGGPSGSVSVPSAPKPETAEPVAWLLKCPGEFDELAWDSESRLTQADSDYGWTETPLYTHPAQSEVVEALKPFAVEAENYDFGDGSGPDLKGSPDHSSLNEVNDLLVGHLRKAREVYNALKGSRP